MAKKQKKIRRNVVRGIAHIKATHNNTMVTITDLNGEQWRANEHGHARVRVSRSLWGEGPVELPAMCVGDIGGAMTALQIILACRSLCRGYATSDHVLITASDEYGHAGAAMIRKETR